jgi:hypothetical protein
MKKATHTEELTIEEVQYSIALNTINWGDQFKHFVTTERIETMPIKTPGTNVFIFAE